MGSAALSPLILQKHIARRTTCFFILQPRLAKLGAENALMIGGAELDSNFVNAASNLPFVDVLPQQGINVYDILRRDVLVLSKDAAAHIEERLK